MIAEIINVNGELRIRINGEIYDPMSFKTFRPTQRNISDFYNAGIRLFNILSTGIKSVFGWPYSQFGESWTGEYEYDFAAIDAQIEFFKEHAPTGYFMLMLQLDTRDWFLEKYVDAPNSFTHLSQALTDKRWTEAASAYLQAAVRHIEEKYGDCVYGYFMLCGSATEWLSVSDHEGVNASKELAYKTFTGDKSGTAPDITLLNSAQSETLLPPDNEIVRYRQFHAKITSDAILYFAGKIQEIICHKKLVGIYFGYIFELGHERLWDEGHLGYERVFKSDDVNIISSPFSYSYRSYNNVSAAMVATDTLKLHKKLYFLEHDNITVKTPKEYADIFGGSGHTKECDTVEKTIDVFRRDFMFCKTHSTALWWFDMFGGWFYSDALMAEVKRLLEIERYTRSYDMSSASEIAVFVDCESMFYVDKHSDLNEELLRSQRSGLSHIGAPCDFFAARDIEIINLKQYKLFIFLNLFCPSDRMLCTVGDIKQNGGTILWLYAPNAVGRDENFTQSISKIIGMPAKRLEENETDVIFEAFGEELHIEEKVKTRFYIDNSANVICRYKKSGKVAMAYSDDEKTIYSAVGNLPGNVLAQCAKKAGVHIYCDEKNPVYINKSLIGVFAADDGEITLKLQSNEQLTDLFTGESFAPENKKLIINARRCESKLFLKG